MFDPDVRLSTKCGTPCYVAPEILTDDHYGPEVDMWSVGVVVYLLLSGTMPFDGENPLDVYQNILNGEYNFRDEVRGNEGIAHLSFFDFILF